MIYKTPEKVLELVAYHLHLNILKRKSTTTNTCCRVLSLPKTTSTNIMCSSPRTHPLVEKNSTTPLYEGAAVLCGLIPYIRKPTEASCVMQVGVSNLHKLFLWVEAVLQKQQDSQHMARPFNRSREKLHGYCCVKRNPMIILVFCVSKWRMPFLGSPRAKGIYWCIFIQRPPTTIINTFSFIHTSTSQTQKTKFTSAHVLGTLLFARLKKGWDFDQYVQRCLSRFLEKISVTAVRQIKLSEGKEPATYAPHQVRIKMSNRITYSLDILLLPHNDRNLTACFVWVKSKENQTISKSMAAKFWVDKYVAFFQNCLSHWRCFDWRCGWRHIKIFQPQISTFSSTSSPLPSDFINNGCSITCLWALPFP